MSERHLWIHTIHLWSGLGTILYLLYDDWSTGWYFKYTADNALHLCLISNVIAIYGMKVSGKFMVTF